MLHIPSMLTHIFICHRLARSYLISQCLAQKHTQIHTQTHTQTHKPTNTHTQTHTQTHKPTNPHTHKHIYTHTHVHTPLTSISTLSSLWHSYSPVCTFYMLGAHTHCQLVVMRVRTCKQVHVYQCLQLHVPNCPSSRQAGIILVYCMLTHA